MAEVMAFKTCPNCSKKLPQDAKACMHCGVSFVETKLDWASWLLQLDEILKSRNDGVTMARLSQTELRSAYDQGVSPADFANSARIFVQKPNFDPPTIPPPPSVPPKQTGPSPFPGNSSNWQSPTKPNQAGVWVAGIIFLGIVIFGVASVIGTMSGNDAVSRSQDVRFGMSKDEVRSIMGEPNYDQSLNTTYAGINGNMDMWYFGGMKVQIVFDHGRVSGINRY